MLINEIPTETTVTETVLISDSLLDKLLRKLRNADATAYDDAAILQNASDTELIHVYELIQRFEFDEAAHLIEHLIHKENK